MNKVIFEISSNIYLSLYISLVILKISNEEVKLKIQRNWTNISEDCKSLMSFIVQRIFPLTFHVCMFEHINIIIQTYYIHTICIYTYKYIYIHILRVKKAIIWNNYIKQLHTGVVT